MRQRRAARSRPVGALSVIVGSSSGRYRHAMTDEDDDEEYEPLQVFPDPVPIKAHDPEVGDLRSFACSLGPGATAVGPVAGFRMCS
jgi:hypothetical protein